MDVYEELEQLKAAYWDLLKVSFRRGALLDELRPLVTNEQFDAALRKVANGSRPNT